MHTLLYDFISIVLFTAKMLHFSERISTFLRYPLQGEFVYRALMRQSAVAYAPLP